MTLLIKVKTHRGDDPLNEESDVRTEMGRLKEQKETIWDDPTNRTVYQWCETSKTIEGVYITKTSVWTNTVRNRIRLSKLSVRFGQGCMVCVFYYHSNLVWTNLVDHVT